jgi:undecaprenyl diphosphate synthase
MKDNFHPDKSKGSLHLGLIPDGGRRWAAKNAMTLMDSYSVTREHLAAFVPKLIQEGVHEISIYLSSSQNYKRDKHVISAFTSAIRIALFKDLTALSKQLNIQIAVAGNPSFLGAETEIALNELVQSSLGIRSARINLCIAYNPIEEIAQAHNLTSENENFTDHLWITNPLDLVIRTGNANLLSNFLPLQSGYARFYFSEKLFNDLLWEDIARYIDIYKQLDLKYGE